MLNAQDLRAVQQDTPASRLARARTPAQWGGSAAAAVRVIWSVAKSKDIAVNALRTTAIVALSLDWEPWVSAVANTANVRGSRSASLPLGATVRQGAAPTIYPAQRAASVASSLVTAPALSAVRMMEIVAALRATAALSWREHEHVCLSKAGVLDPLLSRVELLYRQQERTRACPYRAAHQPPQL